jgi:hypothetical protein
MCAYLSKFPAHGFFVSLRHTVRVIVGVSHLFYCLFVHDCGDWQAHSITLMLFAVVAVVRL